ncbi:MAG: GH92 family glycosyl hydrolase [Pontiellaceae bacterium]|nr:GH92 family glycosyl hydrolase [Pontiellaceae bacterium]MBN2785854.1 GH92 family glycosyl hydrolase [Pontiellaceae bacterium]
MKQYAAVCAGLSLLLGGTGFAAKSDYVHWVNPFIGTGSMDSLSLSGSNFPGPVVPFGLVQLSPDTAENPENPCSGYDYADDTIYGFSHTHLSGTGVADLFDFLFMPFKGDRCWAPSDSDKGKGYSSKFSHDNEAAEPGYYRVFLDGPQVQAELTATEHCGVHRYSDKKGEPFSIMIDLDHSLDKERPYWVCRVIDAQIRVVDDHTIEGYRALTGWASERRVYFRAEFSRPFASTAVKAGHRIFDPAQIGNHKNLKLIASFAGSKEPLTVNVGLSSVSYQGARDNLAAEVKGFDFDAVRSAAKEKWNKELSVFDVEGTDKQKMLFYTSLYHLFIHPSNLADVNGDYLNCNGTLCNAPDKAHYSTFSLWDTYRAAHPLFTLTQEKRTAGFINSMLRQYTDYGYLPIWQLWGKETYCMIGNHAIPVIVDAYFKQIPGVDYALAYEAVKASSTTVHPGSPFNIMEKYKYLPEDIETQSVSIALEVAFNDWCAAQMAKALGHDADYRFFMERAGYYKNLFDPSIGFFRGKDSEGKWIEPFSPLKYGGNGGYPFTEGNAWQYLWYVPQDVYGLRDLFGGEKQFSAKLDEFFTLDAKPDDVNGNASGFIGQYAHGNEPSHHIAYLYNYTKTPWKAQAYVAKILDELYLDTPYGYSGNEDCGQMSAWYIFSALGFYPVNPANGIYCFGSPLLKNAALHLANGNTFSVRAENAGKDNVYIQSITLNGKPYQKTFITHRDIEAGGELVFRMGSKPNKAMAEYDKPE